MTVEELIKELSKFDQDKKVHVVNDVNIGYFGNEYDVIGVFFDNYGHVCIKTN